MAGCPALDRVRDGQAPAEVVHALKEIAQIGENDAPAPAFGAEAGEGGEVAENRDGGEAKESGLGRGAGGRLTRIAAQTIIQPFARSSRDSQ